MAFDNPLKDQQDDNQEEDEEEQFDDLLLLQSKLTLYMIWDRESCQPSPIVNIDFKDKAYKLDDDRFIKCFELRAAIMR